MSTHASVLPTPHPWGCPRRSPHLLLRLRARPPARVGGAVRKGRGLRLLRGTWLVPWVTHGIKAWPPRGAAVSWRGRGAGPGAARAWRAPEGLQASSTVQVGTALPPRTAAPAGRGHSAGPQDEVPDSFNERSVNDRCESGIVWTAGEKQGTGGAQPAPLRPYTQQGRRWRWGPHGGGQHFPTRPPLWGRVRVWKAARTSCHLEALLLETRPKEAAWAEHA